MANNKIFIKRTATSGNKPTTAQIANGELAVNMTDGILYSTNGSTVFEIGANVTSMMTGNTTANITGNTTMLRIANSTSSANLTPTTLTIGTSVVNTTVIAVGSNNFLNTTALDIGNTVVTSVNLTLGGQVTANGGVGTAGQVLTSGAAGNAYWTTPTVGTVTSVASGNGITGGTITSSGTLSVVANSGLVANTTGVHVVPGNGLIASNSTGVHVGAANGITVTSTTVGVTGGTGVVVNATGVHVNSAYIGTLSANNTTYVNGKTEGNLNVNNATRLATGRTFTIGSTGKTFDGTNGLTWTTTEMGVEAEQASGVPRSNLGTPTVREAALFDAQFDNKTERFNIANIWLETSTDNVTWTDAGVSDANKRLLVGGDAAFSSITIPYNTPYYRVRLRAVNYVYINALYSYFSTNGHTTGVQIWKKHDSGSWTQHTSSTAQVSSWPGHLYLPFSTVPWHPSGTLGTHFHEVYILFTPTWNPTWSANGISLSKFQLWGGYPAARRNLYSTDEFGNATFPGSIAVANGSASAPAFDFASDTNTGMYLSGADTLGFSTNGSPAAEFTSTGNLRLYNTAGTFYSEFSNQPTANRTITFPDGNVTLVAGTMVPTTGTGATGSWGISVTGSAATLTTARNINGTSFNGSADITTANWGTARTIWGQSINGSANITAPLLPAAGSVTAPAFSTSGDTNTGMYFPAADTLGFATNGTLAAQFTSTGNLRLYNTAGTFYSEFSNQPTANRTITVPDGDVTLQAGTMALTGGNLSQFASTTSAQLAGVISDETGSGSLVFATSPALAGTPTAPTAAVGTNTTQIATTAFVNAEIANDAALLSGGSTFTGAGSFRGFSIRTSDASAANWSWFALGGTSDSAGNVWHVATNGTAQDIGNPGAFHIRGNNGATSSVIVNQDHSVRFRSSSVFLGATTNTGGTQVVTNSGTWGISISGSAATLTTARSIALSGAATGTATNFNGSANITIPVTALNASNLSSGTVPDARLSGTYTGFTHKIDGTNTIYTSPNPGSTSTNGRTVYGLAEYKSDSSAQVGAIVFAAPTTATAIMHQLEVQGMLYNQNIFRMTVQGYRNAAAWSDTRKISFGTVDVQTRWAVTPDGKQCLILGDVGTTWSYPHFSIVRGMFSHTGVTDAYCSGWTVSVVTDLSTYTQLTGTIADSTLVGSITGSATTLTTARNINGTSFNGSADITTANWGTARTIWGQSINGSANITAPLLPAAGAVTAPAFSTSGDTNTGMYFPAADTIGFATNGTLAAQFTSTGNLRLYNTAGTFYSEFSNQPTANRTLTVPDVSGTIAIVQAAATAGYFDTSTTTPTGTTRLNYGGYFYPTFLNLIGSADTSTAASHYFVETGSDGFVRPKTLASVQSEIVTSAVLGSGTANSTTFLAGDRTWKTVSGGGYYKGGASAIGSLAAQGQNIFRVNANTLNVNTTFVAGENGQATGPLTVAAGITLTVQTGARVSIV